MWTIIAPAVVFAVIALSLWAIEPAQESRRPMRSAFLAADFASARARTSQTRR